VRRVVIFDYNSRFCGDIVKTIRDYNTRCPDKAFLIDIFRAEEAPLESQAGPTDIIIHSGGDGEPVGEDVENIPKLYICHSHQWKAKKDGGEVVRLKDFVKGVQAIDIIEDDDILGGRGKMLIMKYHSLAVTRAPGNTRVLAKSKTVREDGEEIEIIEALKYSDGSISIQGHPEEGAAGHIFQNFFERVVSKTDPRR
jgi:anthranilate/para-aminobenzoate synthase component II